MTEVLKGIDWNQVIYTIWTVVLLPVVTYIGTEINAYAKAKRIDKLFLAGRICRSGR